MTLEKTQRSTRKAVSSTITQKKDSPQNAVGFLDNREKSKSMRILQSRENDSSPLPKQTTNLGTAQQAIVQRFSVTAAKPNISILNEDKRGGHTEDRHVAKSERYLKDRAPDTPEGMASSYTSLTVANNETKKCVHENWDTIKDDWEGVGLSGRRGNVWYESSTSGKKYFYKIYDKRGKEKIASTIRVGLSRYRPNGNAAADEVYIKTSHPTV